MSQKHCILSEESFWLHLLTGACVLLRVKRRKLCLQVPVLAHQRTSWQGAHDAVIQEAVLPNGAVLQLSLRSNRDKVETGLSASSA